MIPKKLPFLGVLMGRREFFEKLKIGELFTYSLSFEFREVRLMAAGVGVNIKYCKPDSVEYSTYGSTTCQVVEKIDKVIPVQKIFHFDEKFLDV